MTKGIFKYLGIDEISTHTPLARRDYMLYMYCGSVVISTHTPLARRDTIEFQKILICFISTHTPLARRDEGSVLDFLLEDDFYSHAPCEA